MQCCYNPVFEKPFPDAHTCPSQLEQPSQLAQLLMPRGWEQSITNEILCALERRGSAKHGVDSGFIHEPEWFSQHRAGNSP